MSALDTSGARLRVVDDAELARGEAIKQRRLALGLKSVRVFAEESGIDREALGKAEKGLGSGGTYERAESWLTRQEVENGHDDPETAATPLRLTLHGIYGIDEMIIEAPADRPDELAQAVGKILEEFRNRQ
jgi:transcriptional regulator with XRE-family HTH domain